VVSRALLGDLVALGVEDAYGRGPKRLGTATDAGGPAGDLGQLVVVDDFPALVR